MPADAPKVERQPAVNGLLLISLATMVWASGGLFTRLLPFDLWTIVFWRGVFATVFIGVYVLYRFGRDTPVIIWRAGFDGVIVTLCSAATVVLFPAAFQHTTVANAFTILAALPFVTSLIAWVWMGERPSGLTLTAAAVAMIGIVIMVGPSGGPGLGDLYAIAGTLTNALMIVAIRRNPQVAMLPMAWAAIILSVVVAYPLATQLWDLGPRDYLVAAGFGLGPMTLGMMLYVIGSASVPAALSALVTTAEAPIGALWAWLGVGETPATATLTGGAIVLCSVVIRLLAQWCQTPSAKGSEGV